MYSILRKISNRIKLDTCQKIEVSQKKCKIDLTFKVRVYLSLYHLTFFEIIYDSDFQDICIVRLLKVNAVRLQFYYSYCVARHFIEIVRIHRSKSFLRSVFVCSAQAKICMFYIEFIKKI